MQHGFDVRARALRDGELAAWLAEHSLGNRFGLAVVGTGVAYDSTAVALAIVAADGEGRGIDVGALTPDDEAALASWLADPGPPKAVHEAKPAMHALAGRGWTLRGVTSDTALAAHLVRPASESLALNDLLVHHMRCALPTEANEPQRLSSPTDPGGPDERAMQALVLRACAVLDLADVLDEELARIDSSSLLSQLELPVQSVLTEMEAAGIAVDRASLDHLVERRVAIDGLLNSIASDGRIHTTFHQTASATGGIVSSDPALHDIPTDPDEAASVRDAFVAGYGYGELMSAGYSQLEMRVMAYLSGDLRAVVDDARKVGYVSTLLGRRRYLPGLDSDNRQVREAADRDARAMLVQGGAADVINVAMINVDKAIKDSGLKSRLLLQVDGELLFEVAAGEREALTAHVREQMGSEHPLHAPLEVSIGYGPNWAAAAQWATLNNEIGK